MHFCVHCTFFSLNPNLPFHSVGCSLFRTGFLDVTHPLHSPRFQWPVVMVTRFARPWHYYLKSPHWMHFTVWIHQALLSPFQPSTNQDPHQLPDSHFIMYRGLNFCQPLTARFPAEKGTRGPHFLWAWNWQRLAGDRGLVLSYTPLTPLESW